MDQRGAINQALEKRIPDMIVRGSAVVRRADGSIKLDAGVDHSRFSPSIRREIAEQSKEGAS